MLTAAAPITPDKICNEIVLPLCDISLLPVGSPDTTIFLWEGSVVGTLLNDFES